MAAGRSARLNNRELAIFSLPVILFQAIEIPWRIYLPASLTQIIGLPLASVGTLLMAIRIFDMAADPIVGWASDRFSFRIGHRRPWMVLGVPLVMLGGWQLFLAQPGTGLAAVALWSLMLHIGYTLVAVPHGGWGLEIADNEHERTRVMGAKVWFACAGVPLVLLVPTVMERLGAGRDLQVAAMGMFIMLLAPLAIGCVVRFIPERRERTTPSHHTAGPLRQLLEIVRVRELRSILLLYALCGLAEASSSSLMIFYVEDGLRLKGWASTLMLVQALVPLATLPVWARISGRCGKNQALIGIFAWQALSMALALIVPPGSVVLAIVFLAIRSMSWGGDFMLLRSQVADAVGAASHANVTRGASYYALFNLTLKSAMALGAGGALWGLAALGPAGGASAPGQHADWVRTLYALPACLSAMLAVAMLIGATKRQGSVVSVA